MQLNIVICMKKKCQGIWDFKSLAYIVKIRRIIA